MVSANGKVKVLNRSTETAALQKPSASFRDKQTETTGLTKPPDYKRGLGRRLATQAFERLVNVVSTAGRKHPGAKPELYDVEIKRDIAYLPDSSRAHLLDVYQPTTFEGPWPVVLYVHGGSFRLLSKESHWMMAISFARRGYLVFNINYRLAPEFPFPAALEDVSAAYLWVLENASRFGGDPGRIIVAGESAGANLVTALTIETTYRRPEPWAKAVFEANRVPDAVMAACGILQVSDPERFGRKNPMPQLVEDRILDCRDGYLAGLENAAPDTIALADPLVLLEQGITPDRPLPPFFAPVGSRDPLVDDSVRLEKALIGLGVPCEAPIYEGEVHAFHMLSWRTAAKRLWNETAGFMDRHVLRKAPGTGNILYFPAPRRVKSNWFKEKMIERFAA